MKWQLSLLLICVIPFAFGLDICEYPIQPLEACIIQTPTLICDAYNYSIYNSTGGSTENGNLTQFNGSIYEFTFNQSTGDYIVKLCDGTTREIKVERWLDMGLGLLVSFFGIGLVCVFFWLGLKGHEHILPDGFESLRPLLKFLFMNIGLIMIPVVLGIALKLLEGTEVFSLFESLYVVSMWIIGGALIINFVISIWSFVPWLMTKGINWYGNK